MEWWLSLILIAIALGTDAFSVAVGIGMGGVYVKDVLVLSGTVLIFHVFMPLIGVFLGELMGTLVGQYAGWLGAGVLIFIGLQMIGEGIKHQEQVLEFGQRIAKNAPELPRKVQGVRDLIILAGSVSMDALSVGFGLGTLSVKSFPVTVGTIGVVAGLMTATGLLFGRFLGQWIGNRASLLGGLVLIIVGVKMVF